MLPCPVVPMNRERAPLPWLPGLGVCAALLLVLLVLDDSRLTRARAESALLRQELSLASIREHEAQSRLATEKVLGDGMAAELRALAATGPFVITPLRPAGTRGGVATTAPLPAPPFGVALWSRLQPGGTIALYDLPPCPDGAEYHLWSVDPAGGPSRDRGVLSPLPGRHRTLFSLGWAAPRDGIAPLVVTTEAAGSHPAVPGPVVLSGE